MRKHREHSKLQDERKPPTSTELRRATWSSVEQIVALLIMLMFEILVDRGDAVRTHGYPEDQSQR